jgi:hypothetical protein
MTRCFSLSLAIVALVALARPAAALPAWCATPDVDRVVSDVNGNVTDALKKDDPVWALYYLVGTTCSADKEVDAHRRDLDAARAYWSKQLDLTEADWADVAVWSTASQSLRYVSPGQMHIDEKKAWSTYDALDQYMAIAAPHDREDPHYLADAFGAGLTETGRLAYIWSCLQDGDAAEVRWAMCQPDIAAFDPAKVSPELRASQKGHDGYQRTIVRLALWQLRPKLTAHAADVQALRAKDDAYGKLFALSDAARKDWAAHAAGRAPLLALASAMDDARVTGSRKALDGCEAKTWDAWKGAVAAMGAKAFDNLRDDPPGGSLLLEKATRAIVADPDGYLASVALAICRADASDDVLAQELGKALERLPGARGPRTAALGAIANAGIVLDDKAATLRFPPIEHDWFGHASSMLGTGSGVIAKVEAHGTSLHVVFVKKMVKQVQCAESRETSRITQIDANGQLRYEVVCVRNETVTVDKASDPQDVDARYAAGVKPGAFVQIARGVVEGVWPSATATVPSVLLGVPLAK